MSIDITFFTDIADSFGISDPGIVEKDYYLVQLLKVLKNFNQPYYNLIFAGALV